MDAEEIRLQQVNTLWGQRLAFVTLGAPREREVYLEEVPPLSAQPRLNIPRDLHPILVEPRISCVRVAQILGVRLMEISEGDPEVGIARPSMPYWIWCHDGRVNNGKKVHACPDSMHGGIGMAPLEGLMLFAHRGKPIFCGPRPRDGAPKESHGILLSGALTKGDPKRIAYLWPSYPEADNFRMGLISRNASNHEYGAAFCWKTW